MSITTLDDYQNGQEYQQRLEEAERALQQYDVGTYGLYSKAKVSNDLSIHEEFQKIAKEREKEILAMEGPQYNDEFKAAQIRLDIEKLANQYTMKAEQNAETRRNSLHALTVLLDDAIAEDSMTNTQLAEMEAMKAKALTDLSFSSKPETVLKHFRALVERSKRCQTTARFASMYAYFYMDRLKELSGGDVSNQYRTSMHTLLDESQDNAYSKETRAKMVIRDSMETSGLSPRFVTSPSIRLIKMHIDHINKKYK